MSKPFGYLLIDLKPQADERIRLRTNIFPCEVNYAYAKRYWKLKVWSLKHPLRIDLASKLDANENMSLSKEVSLCLDMKFGAAYQTLWSSVAYREYEYRNQHRVRCRFEFSSRVIDNLLKRTFRDVFSGDTVPDKSRLMVVNADKSASRRTLHSWIRGATLVFFHPSAVVFRFCVNNFLLKEMFLSILLCTKTCPCYLFSTRQSRCFFSFYFFL